NLHEIAEMREKTGKRAKERERYARCLKSLLMVGDKNPDHNRLFNKELSHTLELLLLQNPYEKKKGDVLEVKLLYKNKILVKKAIEALHFDPIKGVSIQLVYTNDEGTARFQLNYAGMWVIRTVHLYPVSGDAEVDWESYWTSYSFAIAE
ncbi:MAG TPA: hypothetical protein DCM08_06190, partial [Microscillaceae bacterium]|nr:hypothetical protein [Microscillaceae bacterium]